VRRRTRTFDAIIDVLRDGGWHALDDLQAATRFPAEWVQELVAEGVIDVREGLVTLVRLRATAVAV
jgi:hypothetical protein